MQKYFLSEIDAVPIYDDKIIFIARKRSLFTEGGGGFPACIIGHMTSGVCIQRICIKGFYTYGGLHCGGGWAAPQDTTGYGQWVGGTHPTGMHACLLMRIAALAIMHPMSNDIDPKVDEGPSVLTKRDGLRNRIYWYDISLWADSNCFKAFIGDSCSYFIG